MKKQELKITQTIRHFEHARILSPQMIMGGILGDTEGDEDEDDGPLDQN